MALPETLSDAAKIAHRLARQVFSLLVLENFRGEERLVYLTFDDGPCPKYTEKLFEILLQLRVPAGFFFNGEQVVQHRELVARIHSHGYFVGNHSFYHQRHSWGGFCAEIAALLRGEEVLFATTGVKSRCYRPPFGYITPLTFLFLLLRRTKIMMWSLDSRDFEAKRLDEITAALRKVKGGDILLFHSDCRLTATHLRAIVGCIAASGYQFGDLRDALPAPKRATNDTADRGGGRL